MVGKTFFVFHRVITIVDGKPQPVQRWPRIQILVLFSMNEPALVIPTPGLAIRNAATCEIAVSSRDHIAGWNDNPPWRFLVCTVIGTQPSISTRAVICSQDLGRKVHRPGEGKTLRSPGRRFTARFPIPKHSRRKKHASPSQPGPVESRAQCKPLISGIPLESPVLGLRRSQIACPSRLLASSVCKELHCMQTRFVVKIYTGKQLKTVDRRAIR
jgi:hypothetical protein